MSIRIIRSEDYCYDVGLDINERGLQAVFSRLGLVGIVIHPTVLILVAPINMLHEKQPLCVPMEMLLHAFAGLISRVELH
jgi:hypothetical protein